jgi:hypothetical protein
MKYLLLICLLSAATSAMAETKEKSCNQEIGSKKAHVLVDRCLMVSPATHPPCNALNSCTMIKDEIKRGCEFIGKDPNAPKFCAST